MIDLRLPICALGSALVHLALFGGMERLPAEVQAPRPTPIAVRIVEPPRPAAPEPPPPEPVPEAPPEVVHELPRPQPTRIRKQAPPPPERPSSERPSLDPDENATPRFGITMQSTSQASAGPQMPVGNVARPTPDTHDALRALPQAITPAAEVTKMPLPRGRCAGKYTEAARAAAIEGVVVLDLTVDEHGRTRDVVVVEPLSHGLTEAAISALAACSFTPGEKAGKPVAVRVRGFKIRFVMPDAR